MSCEEMEEMKARNKSENAAGAQKFDDVDKLHCNASQERNTTHVP